MKAWPVLAISLIEVLLLFAHWFLFHTWITFWNHPGAAVVLALRLALLLLSLSFVAATLLGFRISNLAVDLFYTGAAVWMGFLNYFFWAACLSWLGRYLWLAWRAWLGVGHGAQTAASVADASSLIAGILFAAAMLAGIYGLINARWIRVRRVGIAVPGLPRSWRGRRAVLMSDLHLGSVNGLRFSRRIADMVNRLRPDAVFIPGDLFDGTKADADRLLAPFKQLAAPLGVYFSTGNHEEFGGAEHYLEAIARAGIRVLNNECVTVDGLRIAGVPFGDSTYPMRLRANLEAMQLNAGQASILLNHMPGRLPIVERAGISVQLSGHTHGGQLFPFTFFTRRVFGRFTYGLHRFGALQVYTSFGAGTWGPPMRVGTSPEIVVLEFS